MPPPAPEAQPAPADALREAERHPLVAALRKRFAADIIRREPLDRAAWQAKLRREAGRGDEPP